MRAPIAAGTLYPSNKSELKNIYKEISNQKTESFNSISALYLANGSFNEFKELYFNAYAYLLNIPEETTFIFISNNKSKKGKPVAISNEDWLTPLGKVSYDRELGEEIKKHSSFAEFDNSAHCFESSIELHLPFVQSIVSNPKLVAITISIVDDSIVRDLVNAIESSISLLNRNAVIIGVSELFHCENLEAANLKLTYFLNYLESFDPQQNIDPIFKLLIQESCATNPVVFLIPFVYSIKNGFRPKILSKKISKTGVKEETDVFLSVAYTK
ncbi:MAG: AmmeMemoRadiSam system protein B [Candidatus Micrarchaeota archaeon]|nr:AmmeMemoRadiSam system protein B [Candidatus Micrarchaeota archaeon]